MKEALREVVKSELYDILGKVLDRLDSIDNRLERVEDQQKGLLVQQKNMNNSRKGSSSPGGETEASDADEEAKGESANQISLHFIYKHKKVAILSFPPSATVETVNETVRLEMEDQDQAYTFPAVQISSTRPKDGVHGAEHPSDKTLEELGIKNNQLIFVRALRLPSSTSSSRSLSQRKSGSRKSSAGRAMEGAPLSPRANRSPKSRRSRASENFSRTNVLAKSFHMGVTTPPTQVPAGVKTVRARVSSLKSASTPGELPEIVKESLPVSSTDSKGESTDSTASIAPTRESSRQDTPSSSLQEENVVNPPEDHSPTPEAVGTVTAVAPIVLYYCTLSGIPSVDVLSGPKVIDSSAGVSTVQDRNVTAISESQKKKEEILRKKKEELRKREAELLRKLDMKKKREEERRLAILEAEEALKRQQAREYAEAQQRQHAGDEIESSVEEASGDVATNVDGKEENGEDVVEPEQQQEEAAEEEEEEDSGEEEKKLARAPEIAIDSVEETSRGEQVQEVEEQMLAEQQRLRSVSDVALPARPAPVPQRLSAATDVRKGASAPRLPVVSAQKSPERDMLEQAVAELSEAADRVSERFDVSGVLHSAALTKDGRMMSVLHDQDLERFKAMQLGKSQLDALADLTHFTDTRNRAQTESPAKVSVSVTDDVHEIARGASKAKSLRGHPEMAAIVTRGSNAATINSSSPELTRAKKKTGPVGSIDNDIKRERSQRQSRVLVHQTSRMRDLTASVDGGSPRSNPPQISPRSAEAEVGRRPSSPREIDSTPKTPPDVKNKRKSKMLPITSPQLAKMNKKSKAQASTSMEQARDKLKGALRKKKKAKKAKAPEEESEEDRRIAEKVKLARAKRKARLSHYQGRPQGRKNDLTLELKASEEEPDSTRRPLSDRPSKRAKALSLAAKPLRHAGDDITLTRKSNAQGTGGDALVRSPRKEREAVEESQPAGKTVSETRTLPARAESEEEDTRSAASSISSKAVSSEEEDTDDDYDCDDSSYDESDDSSGEEDDDSDDDDNTVRREMQELILKAKQSGQHA